MSMRQIVPVTQKTPVSGVDFGDVKRPTASLDVDSLYLYLVS